MALAIAKAAPFRPEIKLSQALLQYESILSPEQKQSYDKSPPDVSAVMALTCEVDRQTAGRKTRRWGARLTTFLNSIQGFTTVADSIVSNMGSPAAGAIWGAVKVAIQTASCYQAYFDSLSTMLMNIGLNSPRIEKYALIYPSSSSLQKELCNYYSVVVNLCTRIVVFVRKPIARQIANALRKSFEDEFGSFQRELGRLGTAVKEEASIAAKQQQNSDSKEGARERKESALYRATGTRFRRETASELAKLRRMREGVQKSRFLTSCSKYNAETSLNQARRKGASRWILQSEDYQQWRDSHTSSTLLCSGIVGSGKTVLCASVIENLTVNKPVDSELAYFFCRYDEAVSLNAREVIGSVARQFFQNLPVEALKLEDKGLNAGVAMLNIQQIVDAMLLLLPQARRYIMVLDGLDECEQEEVSALIHHLRSLVASSGAIFKVFWSGRADFVPRFSQQLRSDFQVQISSLNNGSEISNFIEVALASALESGKLKLRRPEIIIQIQEALEADAHEMFLWVVFQIDSICAQNSDHDILMSLKNLPKGLPATFRRILRRLRDSAFANPHLARIILELVAGAQRPLSLDELGEAMSLTPGNTSWDSSKLINDVLKLLECCGSLLVVDEEFSTIHFAHSSVKEYLKSEPTTSDIVEYHIDLARADSDLGRLCVTYLNLDVFHGQLTKSNGQSRSYAVNVPVTVVQSTLSKHESIKKVALAMLKGRRMLKNDSSLDFQKNSRIIHTEDPKLKNNFFFLSYCQKNWLHHTKYIHHLRNDQAYKLWERLVNESVATVELPWGPEKISSGGELLMNWLRTNRHTSLIKETFQQLWNSRSSKAALLYFSRTAQGTGLGQLEELLRLLPDEDERRNLSLVSQGWRNGLLAEAEKRNLSMIFDECMEHLLAEAVSDGHELFVRLLLRLDSNVDAHSKSRMSALHKAISKDNKNMVTLLVDHGADINHSDQYSATALQAAASILNSHSIIEFLIEKGADVNACGGEFGTALIAAVSTDNVGAIELLVDAGADINASHQEYGTALIYSITGSNSTLVTDILLELGADSNARGGKHGTALIAAASQDNWAAIELLVNAGADLNASHEVYGTALMNSISDSDNALITETLLGKGADVNAHGGDHGTALIKAVSLANFHAVNLLLNAGADVNDGNEEHGTALNALISTGYLNDISGKIFDRLISGGADVNHRPRGHDSALMTAVKYGNSDAVARLLLAGADVNAHDGTYGTALIRAVSEDKLLVTNVLLDAGADVNDSNEEYGSALNALLLTGYPKDLDEKLFDRLVSGGADINHKASGHDLPLLSAVKFNHPYAVTKLLEAGADVSQDDETLSSPLKIAAKKKFKWVVQALLNHDLHDATNELDIYDGLEAKDSIKEIMKTLETDEDIARLICEARAERLRLDRQEMIQQFLTS